MSKLPKIVDLKGIVPDVEYLDGETPTIKWNGTAWPIPPLAPKQNRHVIPLVMRSRAILGEIRAGTVSEAQMDDLYSIVFWGLKAAHPKLTREQFDEVHIKMDDLMAAMTVVANATGAMKEKAEVGEDTPQGEDKQATAQPQTGTQ